MKNFELVTIFDYNHFVINKNLESISHEESLISLQAGGNCLNMILGHIVVTRDALLECLGLEDLCDEKITKLYVQGSPPVKPGEAINIKELLKMYNESQVNIKEELSKRDFGSDEEKIKNIAGLSFHEAYHAGQLGVLRRIVGKDGALK
jgi:hypothetical protein